MQRRETFLSARNAFAPMRFQFIAHATSDTLYRDAHRTPIWHGFAFSLLSTDPNSGRL